MTESRFTAPPPITLSGLRNHFSTTYGLDDQQVEMMVSSSRRSLEKIFGEARSALDKDDVAGTMTGICHSLKGLFLNMGEPGWADVARELEQVAKEEAPVDFRDALDLFYRGVVEILAPDDAGSEYKPANM